jgi:Fic family protein
VAEDLAVELASVAAALAGKLSEETVCAVSTLVRSMNCYYSNLIEGHQTHPVEIERALKGDYSSEPHKRDLQLEAFAHIEVQAMSDSQAPSALGVARAEYIFWLHREFCSRLPAELLKSRDPKTHKEEAVVPGEFRRSDVLVGGHLAPVASELDGFMRLFEDRYRYGAVRGSHSGTWIHLRFFPALKSQISNQLLFLATEVNSTRFPEMRYLAQDASKVDRKARGGV